MSVEGTEQRCPSQTRQVSHLKHWEGTCEDGTSWRFNRHRDSLDITDEELSTSIVSTNIKPNYSQINSVFICHSVSHLVLSLLPPQRSFCFCLRFFFFAQV